MVDEPAQERAVEFHRALLEVLKQLNRAELEEGDVQGLEQSEIFLLLRKGPCPYLSETEMASAVDTLLANRMARRIEDPAYAWDRGRVLGARYALTLEGKEYLLKELERVGRID